MENNKFIIESGDEKDSLARYWNFNFGWVKDRDGATLFDDRTRTLPTETTTQRCKWVRIEVDTCARCDAPHEYIDTYGGLDTKRSCLRELGDYVPLCPKCRKLTLRLMKKFLGRPDDHLVDSMLKTMKDPNEVKKPKSQPSD